MFQPTRGLKRPEQGAKTTVVAVPNNQPLQILVGTAGADALPGNSPVPALPPALPERGKGQTRIPVISGEAHYKGLLKVDGLLIGQLGSHGGSLGLRQKTNSVFASEPELSGEISFQTMLRVHGHIAGTVCSKDGTLIVDASATIEANIHVAVAVIGGTVRGDIVAHERLELGPGAKIYGNIWTRSIAIKDGAVFDGVCTMLDARGLV